MNPNATITKAKTMYAKTTINIREFPNKNSKIKGKIHWNDAVKIIKRFNKKWLQIKYKNKIRYICSKYLRKKKIRYKSYKDPIQFKNTNHFKSYEDAKDITNSTELPHGRLKKQYHLDKSGVYMVNDRYCIAIGSYYTKEIGVKVDLILSNKKGKIHILKCITADSKADRDTINKHRVHSDGSQIEFIVSINNLSKKTRLMGNISYAGKQFKGHVKEIRIYDK